MAMCMLDFDIEIAELWKAVDLLQRKLGQQRIQNNPSRFQLHDHIAYDGPNQKVVTIIEDVIEEEDEEPIYDEESEEKVIEYAGEEKRCDAKEVVAESDVLSFEHIDWNLPPVYDEYPEDNYYINLIDASQDDDDYVEDCFTVFSDDQYVEVRDKPSEHLFKDDSNSDFNNFKDGDHMNILWRIDFNLNFDSNINQNYEDPFWSEFLAKYEVSYALNQIRLHLEIICLQIKAKLFRLRYAIVQIHSTNILKYLHGWSKFIIVCAIKFWFARKPKLKHGI